MEERVSSKRALTLFFAIAYALPIAATLGVVLVAGVPSGIVTNELSTGALVVVFAMVLAPAIAAIVVVSRTEGFEGIRRLFGQLLNWRHAPRWYLQAILIFPITILAILLGLAVFSVNFAPVMSLSVLAFAALLSSLWEEIGWTGFATPEMLQVLSPLKVGLVLGGLHAVWHLPANLYGAGAFHGSLFFPNFVATAIGIVGLRIVIVWIYSQTRSLVLGWLTHASFTGGQLLLVSLALTSPETAVWNAAFALAVTGIAGYVLMRHKKLMTQ